MIQVTPLALDGLLLIQPTVFKDERGFFLESFNQRNFNQHTGLDLQFVQDNHSQSSRHVLRGLHFQQPRAQGKLIRVLQGHIYDVVVDLRPTSATFGQWLAQDLSSASYQQLWVPAGFAHGFLVLSATADVMYKTTDYYAPANEHGLAWNDPDLAIDWPLLAGQSPFLSAKDAMGLSWQQVRQMLNG